MAFSEAKLQSLCQEPGCECSDDAEGFKEVQCQCVHNQVRNTPSKEIRNVKGIVQKLVINFRLDILVINGPDF